ncbi:HPr(Ser) kinase/phosphatase [Anaerosalibacter bizertensis]|uniref:HPr kinase/phosphorylase n=1 Tax=Anaerosalibacter bizertensis TaxID=932217 RepID=A0A9Q4AAR0_9FIRM|nr:HPr(Ser) kinase/phosphatase [Anaerosalibacter bizertensis]MBV1816540.1 HPr(Ser) kinase/phosphatase [Bacteroidales bacterium MSK.15.36]MCB5560477.1 HPr(Ser) kinase/phosphatase [Anaerosalibacter bizertensis]MCG4563927.1 HPr(Ser) kinase/phosphatase [Anaerosalibacter bizertensis]MCG4585192.1 HPr(Ser) kinase/phosphatase [Anaerosalibacter bizertensis]
MDYITLNELVKALDLEIIYKSNNIDEVKINKSDVNRPGLQLAGYFDHFAHERLQLIGNVEWHYLNSLPEDIRCERIEKLFSHPIPAMVISRGLEPFPEMIEFAKEKNVSFLRTEHSTTKFINLLINHLDYVLAPEITVHGVLVEVYGMGALLIGESGVGKSETALELIKRGHRLVADDTVEIKRVEDDIRGTAPELIRHFMEIRGIGIVDIERLYGVSAVKNWEFIDLVIELEFWDEEKEYDRIGLDEEYTEILGIKVPKLVIPVRPGRNTAMIVEVATRNNRQKMLGYNAAIALDNKVKKEIEKRRRERMGN